VHIAGVVAAAVVSVFAAGPRVVAADFDVVVAGVLAVVAAAIAIAAACVVVDRPSKSGSAAVAVAADVVAAVAPRTLVFRLQFDP